MHCIDVFLIATVAGSILGGFTLAYIARILDRRAS